MFGRTDSHTVVPFTFIVYLVMIAPPSNVDAPHVAVSLEIPSATAAKRAGAPGATFGVCSADAVLALDSEVAWSVTVTTLNSRGAGPVELDELGGVTAAAETGAE